MSKFLDLLLKSNLPNLQKDLPERAFAIPRLSPIAGAPVAVTVRGLPYGKIQELRELDKDVSVHILLAGCPELKEAASDPELQERFGTADPAGTLKCLLLPGEIEDLSLEVEKLCGYRRRTINEVKNA